MAAFRIYISHSAAGPPDPPPHPLPYPYAPSLPPTFAVPPSIPHEPHPHTYLYPYPYSHPYPYFSTPNRTPMSPLTPGPCPCLQPCLHPYITPTALPSLSLPPPRLNVLHSRVNGRTVRKHIRLRAVRLHASQDFQCRLPSYPHQAGDRGRIRGVGEIVARRRRRKGGRGEGLQGCFTE